MGTTSKERDEIIPRVLQTFPKLHQDLAKIVGSKLSGQQSSGSLLEQFELLYFKSGLSQDPENNQQFQQAMRDFIANEKYNLRTGD